jgi:hypothetical protein
MRTVPRVEQINADWETLTLEAQNEILDADVSAKQLMTHPDRNYWLAVGRGFSRLRTEALRLAHTNNDHHPNYRAHFNLLLAGMEVYNKPQVRALIDQETQKRLDRLQITGDDVAKYWWRLATSDARELSPIARAACRHCYGVDFQYQFTLAEFRLARGAHLSKQLKLPPDERKPFDELGGIGYDRNKPPNPQCPECNGKGIWVSRPIDLDNLSPGAALLFDGIKQDRHGNIEFRLRDRSRALEMFGYITGLGPKPGSMINFAQFNELNIEKLTDEQLDALLARLAMSMSREERATGIALEDMRDITPHPEDADL